MVCMEHPRESLFDTAGFPLRFEPEPSFSLTVSRYKKIFPSPEPTARQSVLSLG